MAQVFAALGKFTQNNKGSVQNFGIVGITVGVEEMLKFIFFFCPCNYPMNQIYGFTFIWGPAAILLVLGYVVNRRTWRLMTGMCNRTQGIGKGGKRIIHFIFIFCNITVTAIVAPATWIVISFLKGDYYTCAAWPGPNDPTAAAKFNLPVNTTIPPPCYYGEKPQHFDKRKTEEIIARDLRAYSHIIGWWFLSWTVLGGIFVVFVFRCMSKYSYEQSKYIDKYRDAEMKLFDEALDVKAQAQAKIIVNQYFSQPRSKEEWDQIATINDKVMKSKRGKPIYSPLHKFSNKELVALELAQDDIVTNSAQKRYHWPNLLRKKKTTVATKRQNPASKESNNHQPTPPQTQPAASPLTSLIPMVAMAPAQKVCVTQAQLHPSTKQNEPNDTNTSASEPQKFDDSKNAGPKPPQSPLHQNDDIPARVTTRLQPSSYHPSLEDDPIKEANVVDRNSIIIPHVADEEDPVLEANVAEQAKEIRRSIQDLDKYDSTIKEIGEQAAFQDDDASESLL